MLVPYTELPKETLDQLISQYITQEHGLNDIDNPVSTYHSAVYRALVEGKLVVVFSNRSGLAWLSAA